MLSGLFVFVVTSLCSGGELAAFEALAAPLFASLRKTFSVGCADFFHSMVSGNLLGGKLLADKFSIARLWLVLVQCLEFHIPPADSFVRTEASGKSGEIFWRTADQRYVLKTVSEQEVGQLIKMLPEYQDSWYPIPDRLRNLETCFSGCRFWQEHVLPCRSIWRAAGCRFLPDILGHIASTWKERTLSLL